MTATLFKSSSVLVHVIAGFPPLILTMYQKTQSFCVILLHLHYRSDILVIVRKCCNFSFKMVPMVMMKGKKSHQIYGKKHVGLSSAHILKRKVLLDNS